MLKKRIIGVITVKGGLAVQSMGYKRYLPLGKPEVLAENLDRWGADEILLQCIDRSKNELGPDLKTIEKIAKQEISTPMIYSGGLQGGTDAVSVVQAGADRVCVDSLLHTDPARVRNISARLGAQALIAHLPVSYTEKGLLWLDHVKRQEFPLSAQLMELIDEKTVSEVILTDWQNEGVHGAYDHRILGHFADKNVPVIGFGGLNAPEVVRSVMKEDFVSAIAIGNFLNYREHAIYETRKMISDNSIRKIKYNDA